LTAAARHRQTETVATGTTISTSFAHDPVGTPRGSPTAAANAFRPPSILEHARKRGGTSTPAHPATADRNLDTTYDTVGASVASKPPAGLSTARGYDARGNMTYRKEGAGQHDRPQHSAKTHDRMTSRSAHGGTKGVTTTDRGDLLSTRWANSRHPPPPPPPPPLPRGAPELFGRGLQQSDGRRTHVPTPEGPTAYTWDNGRHDWLNVGTPRPGISATRATTSIPAQNDQPTAAVAPCAPHLRTTCTQKQASRRQLTRARRHRRRTLTYGYDLNENQTSRTTTGVDVPAADNDS